MYSCSTSLLTMPPQTMHLARLQPVNASDIPPLTMRNCRVQIQPTSLSAVGCLAAYPREDGSVLNGHILGKVEARNRGACPSDQSSFRLASRASLSDGGTCAWMGIYRRRRLGSCGTLLLLNRPSVQ